MTAGGARPFLTARWVNLVLVNYRVPRELLLPHVPLGSELDTPDDAPDLHLLSLVAFHFDDTRVRGVPLVTARHFPEVNLRCYVRRGPRRATVFLREFVPAPLVALGARLLYQQPYHLATIAHRVAFAPDEVTVWTDFRHRAERGAIRLRARNAPATPPTDSQEHFLKEHYWGFDRDRRGASFRYRVEHPVWRTYPVADARVTCDPGALLGGAWRGLDWPAALHSVLFAAGSAVTVYGKEELIVDG
ncbi:MAG TPA: DUF2071 domain-containing protein [Thermomicrobiales bacterium]|nr:DUF2071 domain-containing protein [Thermomicrobiales bacterium]